MTRYDERRIHGSEVVAYALEQGRAVELTPAERGGFHLEIDGEPITEGKAGLATECFGFPILENGRLNRGIPEGAVDVAERVLFGTDPPHCPKCYGYRTRWTVTTDRGEGVTVLRCRRCKRTRPERDDDE